MDWLKQDLELAPDLQRQSIEGAERKSWSGLRMLGSNRTSLKYAFHTVETKIETNRNRDIVGEGFFLNMRHFYVNMLNL